MVPVILIRFSIIELRISFNSCVLVLDLNKPISASTMPYSNVEQKLNRLMLMSRCLLVIILTIMDQKKIIILKMLINFQSKVNYKFFISYPKKNVQFRSFIK